MKKIKVAQVITRMDWGGSCDIVRVICERLNPESYDIRLISGPTRYPSKKTREFSLRFLDRFVTIPQLERDISPLKDFIALIQLYFCFRKERFDIVHTHTAKAGMLGRLAARLAGVPAIIHTPHGHNFYGYFGPLMTKVVIAAERFAGRFTDRIIVLTDLEKQDLIKFGVAMPQKIIRIQQGLELEEYADTDADRAKMRETLGIQSGEKAVGMIARLEPVKGAIYFVDAACRIAKKFRGVKFIITGEGSLRRNLEERVGAAGLKERFIFTGWREDIPQLLSALDILVLPSLNEAVGMILLEAQSAGVAVIASNVGGIPEIVKNEETGILVEPGNAEILSAAIEGLLKDEAKRKQIVNAGRNWVTGKFKTQEMVNAISDLYSSLLSQ